MLLILLRLSKGGFKEIVTSSYYRSVIRFTVSQALLSSFLSVIAGLPGAYILSHRKIKARKLIECVYYLPFVLPSILLVLGFVIFYGNNGYLNNILYALFGIRVKFLYSFKTILAAHVFFNFPVAVSIISNSWKRIDSDILNAAKTDGAGSLRIFTRITLPYLLPSVASALSLIFIYCITSFAIILVLGGTMQYTTTEVEIYRQARISLNFDNAAALSMVSLLFSLFFLRINAAFENKSFSSEVHYNNRNLKKTNFIEDIYLILSVLFLILPILSIVLNSFNGSLKTVTNNINVILNTFAVGLSSALTGTLISLCLCFLCKNNKNKSAVQVFGMMPMATSSVIIGLSYIFVGKYLSFIPDFILIVLAHSAIVTPFAFKSLLADYSSIEKALLEASSIDGSFGFKTFRYIELPTIIRNLTTSFVFCFAISCGELNSTILLGNFTTLPLMIYRLTASYDYSGACAMGTVLLLLCVLVFFISQNKDS